MENRMSHTNHLRQPWLVLASLCAVAFAPSGWSAESAPTAGTIEEVLVTAQKREQSLQDVPLTVTVLGGDDIAESGTRDITDLFAQAPGLFGSQDREDMEDTRIRGIGSQQFSTGIDPSIGYFVEGFYQGRDGAAGNLFDLDRIEVINGPTASLFGQAAIAGAISVIPNKPGGEFGGQVSARIGQFKTREFEGAINVPFSENLSMRIAGILEDHDGYIDNITTGGNDRGEDNRGARAALRLISPDQRLDATLTYESQKRYLDGTQYLTMADQATVDYFVNEFTAFLGFDPQLDPLLMLMIGDLMAITDFPGEFETSDGCDTLDFTTFSFVDCGVDAFWDNQWDEVRLVAEYDLTDNLSLAYSAARREQTLAMSFLVDGLRKSLAYEPTETTREQEIFQQDGRVIYQADNGLVVIGGVSYSNEENGMSNVTSQGLFGTDAATVDAEARTRSFYADVTVPLGERLTATGALRRSTVDKDMTLSVTELVLLFTFPGTFEIEDEWDNLAGRVAVDIKLTDDATLYAAWSQGWKPGGFDENYQVNLGYPVDQFGQPVMDTPQDGVPTTIDEEESTSVEVGLRSHWFDRTLLLNITAFRFTYKGLQTIDAGPPPIVVSVGEVAGSGVDMVARWLLNENWSVGSTVGYLRNNIEEGATSPGFDPVTYAPITIIQAQEGWPLGRTPKWQFSSFLRYEASAFGGNVHAQLDYSSSSEFYTSARPVRLTVEGAELVNLRAGYTSGDGAWSVYAGVTNLLDTFNYYNVREFLGGARGEPGRPRLATVGVTYSF